MYGLPKRRDVKLTEAKGLSTLPSLQKQVCNDSRRCVANINLNKSMAAWMVHKARGEEPDWLKPTVDLPPLTLDAVRRNSVRRASTGMQGDDEEPLSPTSPRNKGFARQNTIVSKRTSLLAGCTSLEQAYRTHIAGFVQEGDMHVSVEELIIILQRCRLFDEFFTADKVRNHCHTWADGCNRAIQVDTLGRDGLGYAEFEQLLRWSAEVKCTDFRLIAQKVIRLAKKQSDQAGTVQQKLESVFDSAGHQASNHMSAFEFGNLCRRLSLSFCMADVILAFNKQPRGLQEGIDFPGFISVLVEVGEKLQIQEEVFNVFSRAMEFLGTKDKMLARLQARLRRAAVIVMGEDWTSFFGRCPRQEHGTIDWVEFMALCKDTLHLQERDSHLEILFDYLDVDASGEFPIQSLIDFMDQEPEPPATYR